MENKTYKDFFFTEEAYIKNTIRADKKIKSFKNGYMNNSKWKKLFLTIFKNSNYIKPCEIFDFFGSQVIELKLNKNINEINAYIFNDFIDVYLTDAEYPISYREIEYLEFRKYTYKWIGTAVLEIEELQNIGMVKEIISKTGQFHWEETEKYIRIYGYK